MNSEKRNNINPGHAGMAAAAKRSMTHKLATVLFASVVVLPACESGENVIGPRGGEVVSEDGRLTLTIPPGALDHAVEIEISEALVEPDRSVNCYHVSPRGTAFAIPATITYELEPEDMEAVDLTWVSERGGTWFRMADRDLSVEDMTLSASAIYLSRFAVVAPTEN